MCCMPRLIACSFQDGAQLSRVSPTATIDVYTSVTNSKRTELPRVVVLGSGWAAMSFVKALPSDVK